MSTETIYAYSNPVPAAKWFYQIGDRWMAVTEGEREDDWFAETDASKTWTPRQRVYPIDQRPPFGKLIYRLADGSEVDNEPAVLPRSYKVAVYTVIVERPIPQEDFHVDYCPGHGHDGSEDAAIAQLAKELQAGWDETGIGGFFEVVDRKVETREYQ